MKANFRNTVVYSIVFFIFLFILLAASLSTHKHSAENAYGALRTSSETIAKKINLYTRYNKETSPLEFVDIIINATTPWSDEYIASNVDDTGNVSDGIRNNNELQFNAISLRIRDAVLASDKSHDSIYYHKNIEKSNHKHISTVAYCVTYSCNKAFLEKNSHDLALSLKAAIILLNKILLDAGSLPRLLGTLPAIDLLASCFQPERLQLLTKEQATDIFVLSQDLPDFATGVEAAILGDMELSSHFYNMLQRQTFLQQLAVFIFEENYYKAMAKVFKMHATVINIFKDGSWRCSDVLKSLASDTRILQKENNAAYHLILIPDNKERMNITQENIDIANLNISINYFYSLHGKYPDDIDDLSRAVPDALVHLTRCIVMYYSVGNSTYKVNFNSQ